jgi:hypothetical protein
LWNVGVLKESNGYYFFVKHVHWLLFKTNVGQLGLLFWFSVKNDVNSATSSEFYSHGVLPQVWFSCCHPFFVSIIVVVRSPSCDATIDSGIFPTLFGRAQPIVVLDCSSLSLLSKAFHSPIFVLPRILNGGLCMY